MFETRRCDIAIAVRHSFGVRLSRVEVNQDGLKLNGTRQLLVYADDVNILAESVYTIKENAKALLVASKEIGLVVNAEKLSRWSGL